MKGKAKSLTHAQSAIAVPPKLRSRIGLLKLAGKSALVIARQLNIPFATVLDVLSENPFRSPLRAKTSPDMPGVSVIGQWPKRR